MATSNTPGRVDADGPGVAAFVAAGSATGVWKLDPAGSRVEFHTASMWGMAKVHGHFTAVDGEGSVSPDGAVTGQLTIDATSLDTKIKKRDAHLRGKDFFDVTRYPAITYSVEKISPLDGDLIEVLGTLTVREQAQSLPFTAKVTEATATAVTVEAELNVDRSQFGMNWRPMRVASLHNRIVVTARFQRTAA